MVVNMREDGSGIILHLTRWISTSDFVVRTLPNIEQSHVLYVRYEI